VRPERPEHRSALSCSEGVSRLPVGPALPPRVRKTVLALPRVWVDGSHWRDDADVIRRLTGAGVNPSSSCSRYFRRRCGSAIP